MQRCNCKSIEFKQTETQPVFQLGLFHTITLCLSFTDTSTCHSRKRLLYSSLSFPVAIYQENQNMRDLQSLNAACDVDDSVGVCSYAHVHCSVMTRYRVPSAFSAQKKHKSHLNACIDCYVAMYCYISHHGTWVAPEPILQGL